MSRCAISHSADALDDFLARLNGEAGVVHVLVIAGDRAECGPFRRAADAIDSGLLRRRGIREHRHRRLSRRPSAHRRRRACSARWRRKSPPPKRPGLPSRSSPSSASRRARSSIISRGCAPSASSSRCASGLPDRPALRRCCAMPAAAACALRRRAGAAHRPVAADFAHGGARRSGAQTGGCGTRQHVSAHFFSFGGVPAAARWAQAVADGRVEIAGEAD